jgi:hypothetical protein
VSRHIQLYIPETRLQQRQTVEQRILLQRIFNFLLSWRVFYRRFAASLVVLHISTSFPFLFFLLRNHLPSPLPAVLSIISDHWAEVIVMETVTKLSLHWLGALQTRMRLVPSMNGAVVAQNSGAFWLDRRRSIHATDKRFFLTPQRPHRIWGSHRLPPPKKSKSKAIPVTCRGGLQGCLMLRIPNCLDNRLTDGGLVFSLTCGTCFTPSAVA